MYVCVRPIVSSSRYDVCRDPRRVHSPAPCALDRGVGLARAVPPCTFIDYIRRTGPILQAGGLLRCERRVVIFFTLDICRALVSSRNISRRSFVNQIFLDESEANCSCTLSMVHVKIAVAPRRGKPTIRKRIVQH